MSISANQRLACNEVSIGSCLAGVRDLFDFWGRAGAFWVCGGGFWGRQSLICWSISPDPTLQRHLEMFDAREVGVHSSRGSLGPRDLKMGNLACICCLGLKTSCVTCFLPGPSFSCDDNGFSVLRCLGSQSCQSPDANVICSIPLSTTRPPDFKRPERIVQIFDYRTVT